MRSCQPASCALRVPASTLSSHGLLDEDPGVHLKCKLQVLLLLDSRNAHGPAPGGSQVGLALPARAALAAVVCPALSRIGNCRSGGV